MTKIATTGTRYLRDDRWHDDRGPLPGNPSQWDPPMTEEEIDEAARSDPDNPPLTAEQLERFRPVSRVKRIRRGFGLSQVEFADRFRIPIDVLRDWESHRAVPDAAATAYLDVIANEREAVERALAATA